MDHQTTAFPKRRALQTALVLSMLFHVAVFSFPLADNSPRDPLGSIRMTVAAVRRTPSVQAQAVEASTPAPETAPAPKPVPARPSPPPTPKSKPRPKPVTKAKPKAHPVVAAKPRESKPPAPTVQTKPHQQTPEQHEATRDGSHKRGKATTKQSSPPSGPIMAQIGTIGGPQITKWVPPRYPRKARAQRLTGLVLLRVTIDVQGRASDIDVVKGAGAGFDEAAIAAVRKSSFSPAMQNGRSVACVALLPVRFKLKGI